MYLLNLFKQVSFDFGALLMASPLRIELAGGLYHVTSRGDRREAFYFNDADRRAWLETLDQVCSRFNWVCHAWCQMTNHYHIVVEAVGGNLSLGMRWLNGVYTQIVNREPSVFLGSDAFLKRMLKQSDQSNLAEIPRAKRRPLAKPLSHFRDKASDAKKGMAAACVTGEATGDCTMQEIADCFDVHCATVSRAVKHEEKMHECRTGIHEVQLNERKQYV
jgi:REP element-mobilizing transposase RayT